MYFDSGSIGFFLSWNNDCNIGADKGSTSQEEWLPLQCQPSPGLGFTGFGPEMGMAERLGLRLRERGIRRAHLLKFAMGTGKCIIPRTTSDAHLRQMLPASLQAIHLSTEEIQLLNSLDGQLDHARADGSIDV